MKTKIKQGVSVLDAILSAVPASANAYKGAVNELRAHHEQVAEVTARMQQRTAELQKRLGAIREEAAKALEAQVARVNSWITLLRTAQK